MTRLEKLIEKANTINESVGGRIRGAFLALRDSLGHEHLSAGSSNISAADKKKCMDAVDTCESKIISILHGKGLLGI